MILEKIDPAKHDLIPEWKEFWTKRMRELHDESVEKKKDELRKSLNLPKDGRERTTELKEKYTIKASVRKERIDASTASVPSKPLTASSSLPRRSRYDRSRSREKYLKSSESYRRSSYEREKSAERYERIDRERRSGRDDRERERDRDRAREHRDRDREHSGSRGSFHEDSPIHRYEREREPADYYPGPQNPYKWHANQPKSHYASKSHYYGRDMPASSIPKYEEPEEEPETNDEPLTVVTVLRLLSALEELLGPSLGPKIVELLAKALALEKVKANSADDLLLNDDNCVLFETIKEKLKAQLMTDMVEKNRIKAVKRAIKNIAGVIHLASELEKNKTPEEKQQDALMKKTLAEERQSSSLTSKAATASEPVKLTTQKSPEEEKQEIAKKLAAALVAQGKTNVSKEELETLVNYYYEQRKAKEIATQQVVQEETAEAAATSSPVKEANASPVNSDIDETAIDLTDEMNENKRDDECNLPQDTSSALESLTDADLQTLLQNFEDLSNEEQQHLHTYCKKLEASNPARVEKLRKYVNVVFPRSDSNDRDDKHRGKSPDRFDTKRTNDSKSQQRARHQSDDPFNDMFYDDSKGHAGASAGIVDSDDDDYSYDDVCKAASKNVKDQREQSRQRSPDVLSDGGNSVNRHDDFNLGGERNNHYDDGDSRSDATAFIASGDNSNTRPTLSDTESIIANLMGSLKNNVQSRNLLDRNLGGSGVSGSNGGVDALNNDAQMRRVQIQKNVPFYMQQQSQNAYPATNANSMSNQMFSNELHGQSAPYANQYGNNAYANQNSNYSMAQQRITSNIPLNIPSFGQQPPPPQQQQQQLQQLTSQQAALFAQLGQQQNRRQAW